MKVTSREDYLSAVKSGREPLLDPIFELEHSLRIEIQRERFGRGNDAKSNDKFYKFVWANKKHYCEECLRPLPIYSSVFISHILSRGAHADMAHDARNTNILCGHCHSLWEHATTRDGMRIANKNKRTIELLKNEYNND